MAARLGWREGAGLQPCSWKGGEGRERGLPAAARLGGRGGAWARAPCGWEGGKELGDGAVLEVGDEADKRAHLAVREPWDPAVGER